jgi:hypothetical protein
VTLTALVRGDVYHSDENELTLTPTYRGNPGWETRGDRHRRGRREMAVRRLASSAERKS